MMVIKKSKELKRLIKKKSLEKSLILFMTIISKLQK